MNIGIVGSRNFTDGALLWEVMSTGLRFMLHPYGMVDAIVSGGAIGADSLGADWAVRNGVHLIEHLPDKERYGWPKAAFERNHLIVRDSDVLLVFFGPDEPPMHGWRSFGSGTMDTVQKAMIKRIPIHTYFQGT